MPDGSKPPPLPRTRNRKPWGKRFGWSLLALFLAAALGHAIWGLVEQHIFRQRIAALQAAGEPIMPADFATANVDASDNAYNDLLAATKSFSNDCDTWRTFQDFDLGLPLRPDEIQTIQAVLKDSATAFADLEKAKDKTRIDWPIDLSNPSMMNTMLPSFKNERALAQALGAAALLAHEQGDDRTSIERIDRMFLLSRIIDGQPSLVAHLVCIGVRALACERLIDIAPELRVGENPNDVPPEALRQTIAGLLNIDPLQRGFEHAFRAERMEELSAINSLASGSPIFTQPGGQSTTWDPIVRYFAKPLIYYNANVMCGYMTSTIAAGKEATWPSAEKSSRGRLMGRCRWCFWRRCSRRRRIAPSK